MKIYRKKIPALVKNKQLVRKRHTQIVSAASRLFSKKGFHSTSMRDISKESDMDLSHMYKYISSKDDILFLFYKNLFQDWSSVYSILKEEESEGKTPVEKLEILIRQMLGLIHKSKREVLTMYTESRHLRRNSLREVLSAESAMVKSLQQVINQGIEGGYFKIKDSFMAANIIQYLMVIEPLRGWNFLKHYTFRRFEDLVIDFILRGLGFENTKV